jgi:hypothetical protein
LKKEPKNFCPLARMPDRLARMQVDEVFLLLFLQKKKGSFLRFHDGCDQRHESWLRGSLPVGS